MPSACSRPASRSSCISGPEPFTDHKPSCPRTCPSGRSPNSALSCGVPSPPDSRFGRPMVWPAFDRSRGQEHGSGTADEHTRPCQDPPRTRRSAPQHASTAWRVDAFRRDVQDDHGGGRVSAVLWTGATLVTLHHWYLGSPEKQVPGSAKSCGSEMTRGSTGWTTPQAKEG